MASGLATVRMLRSARPLPPPSARPWRALACVGGLLTVGQTIAALRGAGLDPGVGGVEDLVQLGAVPLGIATCLRLAPPGAERRIGSRVLLDGAIVLVSLVVLAEILLAGVLARTDSLDRALLTVGYPGVGALLCGVGLVTVARVDGTRRRAATWLLGSIVSMSVVAVAGALGRVTGSAALDVVTQVAWIIMLCAAIRAVGDDPGQPHEAVERPATMPLFGILLSCCTAYGVGLVLTAGLIAGRELTFFESIGAAVIVLATFVRSMVFAADSERLTRRLLRTEAYFRALVHSAEDVTVVIGGAGVITWVSGAVRAQLDRSADELTGRSLAGFLDAEDRHLLERVTEHLTADGRSGRPVVVRWCTPGGAVRDVEVSGAARAGVPGTGVRDGLVLHLRDVTARRSSERERMAYTDYVTGLPNRARFMAELAAAAERAVQGEPSSVLIADLDGFKAVNDVAGHDAGDRLLEEVAGLLRLGARENDLVARIGGDEFALLVRSPGDEAAALAERLVTQLDRSYRAPTPGDDAGAGPVFALSGSVGVAELVPGEDPSSAVRQADLALRAAKAAGKRCVRSAGQAAGDAMGRRARLAADLPGAIEQGQLQVGYQPIVGRREGRVVGLEALVRWEHPVLGSVPPDDFIGLAEDDGLIVPLQRFVLGVALREVAPLLRAGHDLRLGVNVSARHLHAGCLAPDVASALAASGVAPQRLVVEVTESVLLDAGDRVERDLVTLRDMGCLIALDDFGRGYSSLAYLARLPVDILKMDREFVADSSADQRSAALVKSVVEMGRTLGMDVVAEGVETADQLQVLADLDCRFVQGWLTGRPVAADVLADLLTDPVGSAAAPTARTPLVH